MKDLRTGQTLPDTTERVTSLAWAADNKTLFLTTEDAVTKRSDKLWRHVLGTAKFDLLYDEKDELYDIDVGKTRDKKYLLLQSEATDTTEARYLRADRPADQFAVFLPREKKHRYYLDHREGLFYIRTNRSGSNFAVMTAPENDPAPKNWKVFVAHRDDVRIKDIDLFKDFAVSVERGEALDHLRIHDFRTGAWTEIAFPEPVYSVVPGRHAGLRIPHLSLQLPEPDDAVERLRLRHRHRQIHPAKAAGSAGRLRPEAVRQRAPVGHRARRRQGADLHRVQEGLRARRQGAALPLRLRLLRHRHAGARSPATG